MVMNELKCSNIMNLIPIDNIPSDDSYELLYLALISRIEHPEIYKNGEDLNKSILYLIQLLKKQQAKQHSNRSDFIEILIEYEKYIGYEIIDATILIGCYLMFTNLRKEG